MSSKTAPDANFYTSAAAFVPSGVSAVSAWLRVASATSDVNGISSVPDAMNTNPAVQSVDARKPVVENSANGLPCMRFATNDVLRWPITAQSSASDYAGWGLWVKTDSTATTQRLMRISTGTGGGSALKLAVNAPFSGGTLTGSGATAAAPGGVTRSVAGGTLVALAWAFWTIEWDKDGASDSARLTLTKDGVLVGTLATNVATGSLVTATGNILIGNGGDDVTASSPYNGLIGPNIYAFGSKMAGAEFGLLTTAARTALRTYQQPT
jgi:hypothetical protein